MEIKNINIELNECDLELLKNVVYLEDEVTWTFETECGSVNINLNFKTEKDDRN